MFIEHSLVPGTMCVGFFIFLIYLSKQLCELGIFIPFTDGETEYLTQGTRA